MDDSKGFRTQSTNRFLFESYLEPGESILWVGQPGRIRLARAGAWPGISVLFGGGIFLALSLLAYGILKFRSRVGTYPSVQSGPHRVLAAFVLYGPVVLYLFSYWPFVKGIIRRVLALRHTCYALTNQRALLVLRKEPRKMTSVTLDTVNRFGHKTRDDGSGYIHFGYTLRASSGISVPRLTFDDIEDVSTVLKLAQDATRRLTSRLLSEVTTDGAL